MAEPHAHSQPIETYGRAPHNRNIWPYNSQAAAPPSRLADSFVWRGALSIPTTLVKLIYDPIMMELQAPNYTHQLCVCILYIYMYLFIIRLSRSMTDVAMVDAVLRSSIGRIRRRSRMCVKQERES